MCIAVAYISYSVSLIMVTITRHVFINISQTEHFSAVKSDMGYKENMRFLVIPILSLKKSWKKSIWAPSLFHTLATIIVYKTWKNCNIFLELKDYLKNHWTNTRLVCTHFNAFFMSNSNMTMKIWISIFFEKVAKIFSLSSALNPHGEG